VTAISEIFPKVVSEESHDVDILKTIALYCGVGLLVTLLLTAGLAFLPPAPQTLDVMDWI
jgi:hypothetical protein